MNDEEKRSYLERYHEEKEKGAPFFPDVLFKDAVVALLVFVILVLLAYFIGIPTGPRANPADTTYTPRPEWYFLFLFQLLKYFPGNLEVIGAFILPTLAVLVLLALPFIDRNPRRYFLKRPLASLLGAASVVGVVALSVLAAREAPAPQASVAVDRAASLYAANCSSCHGTGIRVPPGTDLHTLIAQGKHEGMPAWGGDLSTDEIDALAGFILSPNGSTLFTAQCAACHQLTVLASGNPLELQRVLDLGQDYPPHEAVSVPNWSTTLSSAERSALLNFLAAPDGQRLFTINCAGCHGRGIAFSGTEEELRRVILNGGQHLEMPAWRSTLSQADLEILAAYVTDPAAEPAGQTLFGQHCRTCHGDAVPSAPDKAAALEIISSGGGHEIMPVWGKVLTPEQLDALVKYTLASSQGAAVETGAQLFDANCAACHGRFGEGGPDPSRPGGIIVPISSAEFLRTRDDATLRAIISQGQPDLGMSPFGVSNGGPLDDTQIDAIVAFLRAWEANPPVELPTEVAAGQAALTGPEIFASICARCHGANGEGGLGPALRGAEFLARYDDQALFNTISQGHEATPMIAWGSVLTETQIRQLVQFIRTLQPIATQPAGTSSVIPSFSQQVLPLLQAKCGACHGQAGGWDASSYDSIMTSGDHAPVIVKGDALGSLLAQKLSGTQTSGLGMPPGNPLTQDEIRLVLDWISAGAPQN